MAIDDLGLRAPGSVLEMRTAPEDLYQWARYLGLETRRDPAVIHAAPAEKRCERHPDHPAEGCPECKGYEVRRG